MDQWRQQSITSFLNCANIYIPWAKHTGCTGWEICWVCGMTQRNRFWFSASKYTALKRANIVHLVIVNDLFHLSSRVKNLPGHVFNPCYSFLWQFLQKKKRQTQPHVRETTPLTGSFRVKVLYAFPLRWQEAHCWVRQREGCDQAWHSASIGEEQSAISDIYTFYFEQIFLRDCLTDRSLGH